MQITRKMLKKAIRNDTLKHTIDWMIEKTIEYQNLPPILKEQYKNINDYVEDKTITHITRGQW